MSSAVEEVLHEQNEPIVEVLEIKINISAPQESDQTRLKSLEAEAKVIEFIKPCKVKGGWDQRAFCRISVANYKNPGGGRSSGDLFFHFSNLKGFPSPGRKPVDVSTLPKEVYVNTETIGKNEKGLYIADAYTKEEYDKIVAKSEEAAKQKEKLESQITDKQYGSQELLKIAETSSQIQEYIDKFLKSGEKLNRSEVEISTPDGRNITVKVEELQHRGQLEVPEDGFPVVNRKFQISCKEVLPGQNDRYDTIEVNAKVKGWKGFTAAYSSKNINSDGSIKYQLCHTGSDEFIDVVTPANPQKPVYKDRELVQAITCFAPNGELIEVSNKLKPDASNMVGEFDISNEIGQLEADKLHSDYEHKKISEIGPIPEHLDIKGLAPGNFLTEIFYYEYQGDDRNGGREVLHKGRAMHGIVNLEISNLPQTEKNIRNWPLEVFNLKSINSLNPNQILNNLRRVYDTERISKDSYITSSHPLEQVLHGYLSLSPRGKESYAASHPVESRHLEQIVTLYKNIPEDITSEFRKQVFEVKDVIALTDDQDIDPSKIVGYTIVRKADDGGWIVQSENDILSKNIRALPGRKTDGVEVRSKLVPVVTRESGVASGGLDLETAWVIKQSTLNLKASPEMSFADIEPGQLVADLEKNIDGILATLSETSKGSTFWEFITLTKRLLDPSFVPQEAKSEWKKLYQRDETVASVPVLDGMQISNNDFNLLPKTKYEDGDVEGIFPPFGNNFELRFRMIKKLKEYIDSEAEDPEMVGLSDPSELRIIVSQMESLIKKVVEFQEKCTDKIFEDLRRWNDQAKNEKDGTWRESDGDMLPNEDTSYREKELEKIHFDIVRALNHFGDQIQGREELGYFNSIPERKDKTTLSDEDFHKLRLAHRELKEIHGQSYEKTFDSFDKEEPLKENSTFQGVVTITEEKYITPSSLQPEVGKRSLLLTVKVPTITTKTIKETGRFAARTVVEVTTDKPQTFDNERLIKFDDELEIKPGTYSVGGVVLNEGRGKHRSERLYFQIQSIREPLNSVSRSETLSPQNELFYIGEAFENKDIKLYAQKVSDKWSICALTDSGERLLYTGFHGNLEADSLKGLIESYLYNALTFDTYHSVKNGIDSRIDEYLKESKK